MAYAALELGQPGNPACPDAYNEESTLFCPDSKKLMLQVSTNAVFVSLGKCNVSGAKGKTPGSVIFQQEQPFLPMIATLARDFDAIRVRNYTKGAKAQVLASAE